MSVDGIVVRVSKGNGEDGVAVLKVSGYLDTTTASELERALYDLLKQQAYRIVVDLAGVDYISSAGWGIFIGEIKDIRHRGGDLKLSGMVGDVYEVFQLLEFHSILQAYDTAEEAVTSFSEKAGNHA